MAASPPGGRAHPRALRLTRDHSIETARLTLRALEADDIGPLYDIQSDRDAMRLTYVAPSRDECARRLEAHEALRARLGFAPWVIVLRSEARVIGWGGLGADPFAPGWGVEVSYFLDPAHWGRGFATEVVRASLEHGFARLALPAIGAFARPENAASIRVLEKCGFTFLRYEPALARNHYEIRHPGTT
jgi:ribosomal-protein-alanine N-acetyltransferase